jgi:hypothetical protein
MRTFIKNLLLSAAVILSFGLYSADNIVKAETPTSGAYGTGVEVDGVKTVTVEAENYDYGGLEKAFHTHHNLSTSSYRDDSSGANIDNSYSYYSNLWGISNMGDNWESYVLGIYVNDTTNEITAENAADNFGCWYNYTVNATADCYVDMTILAGMNFNSQSVIVSQSSGWNKPRSAGGYTVKGLLEDWSGRYDGAFLLKLDGVTLKGSQLSRPVCLDDTTSHIVSTIKDKTKWTSTLINGEANDTVWVWCNADNPYSWAPYYQDSPQFTQIHLTAGTHTFTVQSLGSQWTFDAFKLVPVEHTGVNVVNSVKLNVYPNPTSDILNVNGINGSYQIISLSSGTVLKEASNEQVDVSDLAPGVYAVRCGSKVVRFIKR